MISIIVPIYNVEKYLRQCLDSILSQTKTDIEIICVNDGSTDSCPQILAEYAKKDHRIRVIHQENGGLGKAYNMGLDHATGKYIGFVEPDDYVAPTLYEELFQNIEENNSDIARCSFYQLYSDWNMQEAKPLFLYKQIKEKRPFHPLDHPDIFLGHSAIWTCLYRASVLQDHNIRFMETPGASFQDSPFWFEVLSSAQAVSLVHKPLYYYRIHPFQSVKNGQAIFWRDIMVQVDSRIKKLPLEKKVKIEFMRLRRSIAEYTWGLASLSKEQKGELASYIQLDYGQGRFDVLAHGLPFLEKILYFLLRYRGTWILSILWNNKTIFQKISRLAWLCIHPRTLLQVIKSLTSTKVIQNWNKIRYPHFIDLLRPMHGYILCYQKNTKLRFIYGPCWQSRNKSMEMLLRRTIEKYAIKKDFEIMISTDDFSVENTGNNKIKSFATARYAYENTIPDFYYGGWPEIGISDYDELVYSLRHAEYIEPETHRVGWIGTLLCEVRQRFYDVAQENSDLFESLVSQSRGTQTVHPNSMTYAQQVKRWKYLIDLNGRDGQWSARTKVLLSSQRICFLVDREMKDWIWEFLIPWVNYVPVKYDLSDLKENYFIIEHDQKLQKYIAQNQLILFHQCLTRDSALERIAKLIHNL